MLTKLQALKNRSSQEEGFTLVEIMVVVVIIGILAAVAIPIFMNQQKAAINAKTKSHQKQLITAIELARANTSQTLLQITGASCTTCYITQGNVDPLTVGPTHNGWVYYNRALDRISNASGMDVRGLLDGYGRPFSIDENEGETNHATCTKDVIGSFTDPYTGTRENNIYLSYSGSQCFDRN